MTTDLTCPKCSSKISATDSAIGKTILCPHCSSAVSVPAPSQVGISMLQADDADLPPRRSPLPEPEYYGKLEGYARTCALLGKLVLVAGAAGFLLTCFASALASNLVGYIAAVVLLLVAVCVGMGFLVGSAYIQLVVGTSREIRTMRHGLAGQHSRELAKLTEEEEAAHLATLAPRGLSESFFGKPG